MDVSHRELLRKHRMDLSSKMDSELILNGLVNMKILTVVDKEIVLSQNSSQKRNEKILDFLQKRGPKAFPSLISILKENKSTELISLLTESEEKAEKEIDASDGAPKSDYYSSKQKDSDSGTVSPADKLAKLDGELDSVDTPPPRQESVDGKFSFGKKKEEKTPAMEIDFPPQSLDVFGDPDSYYPMNQLPCRGKFLLINNKNFLPESGMEPYVRNGTDVDAAEVKALFEELGFEVEEHRNITINEIRRAFKSNAHANYKNKSAFAACVLSHGQEGILYGTDGTIEIKELTGFFRERNLAGKPKLFFFQACQGSEYMDPVSPLQGDGDETDGRPEYGNDISLPTESDFLYAYSTVPGYYSWRNSTKGSWFIQAIVETFRKYAHKMDLVRMLTRVNQIVSTKKSQTGMRQSHHKRQISSIVTQLRKELYFFPPHGPLKQFTVDN